MKNIFILLFLLPLAIIASCKPGKHTIEKITFSTAGGMSRAHGTLTIDSNRRAIRSYTTEMGENKGPMKCTIDATTYHNIISELNALDFPNLKDNYTENATDCSTYILTITYDNGKVKTIQDYCRQGPKDLVAFYQDLFIMEDSQTWKQYK